MDSPCIFCGTLLIACNHSGAVGIAGGHYQALPNLYSKIVYRVHCTHNMTKYCHSIK